MDLLDYSRTAMMTNQKWFMPYTEEYKVFIKSVSCSEKA